ncbi:MAG: hypothetical protein WAM94_12610 [Chromatiaceae bacterium]
MSEVRNFLLKRRLLSHPVHASELEIAFNDSGAALRRRSSHERGIPIRQAFFDKLMRWHQFPLDPLYRMTPEELLPLLNAALRLIGKTVIIYVEDGDAITIVSTQYGHIADEMLLDRIGERELWEVTRTDHFMRVFSEKRKQIEVEPGDCVGVGASIVNSETGFRALSTGWYLLRLVCSNGAVVPLSLHSEQIYHTKVDATQYRIDTALGRLSRARAQIEKVAHLLNESLQKKLPRRRDVEQVLSPILGFVDTRKLIDPHYANESARLYDLFNAVTQEAQNRAPRVQLAMEEAAGLWLWGPAGDTKAEATT